MPIRVAVIEDEEDISQGLNYLIRSSEGFVCSNFPNAEEALKRIDGTSFDIVLMDINLPGMNGIECTQKLKQKYPALQIMMCTVYEDDEKIFRAIASGASGYILKRTEPARLIDALRDLYAGGSPISSQIARKVISSLQLNSKYDDAEVLSEREQEVLALIAKGFRNKEVADKLFISISTVKSHIHNIYEKLHVTSRIEAVNRVNGNKR